MLGEMIHLTYCVFDFFEYILSYGSQAPGPGQILRIPGQKSYHRSFCYLRGMVCNVVVSACCLCC